MKDEWHMAEVIEAINEKNHLDKLAWSKVLYHIGKISKGKYRYSRNILLNTKAEVLKSQVCKNHSDCKHFEEI